MEAEIRSITFWRPSKQVVKALPSSYKERKKDERGRDEMGAAKLGRFLQDLAALLLSFLLLPPMQLQAIHERATHPIESSHHAVISAACMLGSIASSESRKCAAWEGGSIQSFLLHRVPCHEQVLSLWNQSGTLLWFVTYLHLRLWFLNQCKTQ